MFIFELLDLAKMTIFAFKTHFTLVNTFFQVFSQTKFEK